MSSADDGTSHENKAAVEVVTPEFDINARKLLI